jgi:hypothetical protein
MKIHAGITMMMLYTLGLLVLAQWAMAGSVNVIGGLTKNAMLKIGGKTEGTILVQNLQQEPQEVKVFQTDYQRFADGNSAYGEPAGKIPRSNAGWITFTPHQFVIPAGETASIYYSILVPQDEKLVGTYWSVLIVEPITKGSLEPPKTEKDKVVVGVQTITRYGIQMITDIDDTGTRMLKFSNRQVFLHEGRQILQVDIENTGERVLTPTLWIELFDAAGKSSGRLTGNRWRILPGCSSRFQIELAKVPPGAYSGLLVADNGDESIFGMQVNLSVQ